MDYRPLLYWVAGIALAVVAILVGVAGFCVAGVKPLLYANLYMALILLAASIATIPISGDTRSIWAVVGTMAMVASWAVVLVWAAFDGNTAYGLPPLQSVAYFAAVSSSVMTTLAYLHLHFRFSVPSLPRVTA